MRTWGLLWVSLIVMFNMTACYTKDKSTLTINTPSTEKRERPGEKESPHAMGVGTPSHENRKESEKKTTGPVAVPSRTQKEKTSDQTTSPRETEPSRSEPVSIVFAGGPVYMKREYSIEELRESGFTNLNVWTIHINKRGNLNLNEEFLLVTNGIYVGNNYYPNFLADIALLKTQPTSIKSIEFGLSSWNSATFFHIKDLVNSQGTGPDSILYKNFRILRSVFPDVDAINLNDEHTYDAKSATSFSIMLADLGFKVALTPYTYMKFWKTVMTDTNKARPGTVNMAYLQCYGGGYFNSFVLSEWIEALNEIPIYPGLHSYTDSPTEVKEHLKAWKDRDGITGAFIWIYDDFAKSFRVQQYASAIHTALR